MRRILLALLVLTYPCHSVGAQEAPSYAKHVRPFLAKYCLECHNAKTKKAGLDLESYKAMLAGSDGGTVLIAGKADDSLIVKLTEGKDKPVMPPKEAKYRPTVAEIKLVRAWVAAGGKDDSANVVAALPAIKPRESSAPPITALAYSPGGELLAAGNGKEVIILDSFSGDFVGKITGLPANVSALASNHDPKAWRLAVAYGAPGAFGDVGIYAYPSLKKPETTLTAHQDAILGVAFGPDDKALATCSYDRLVKVWDAGTGQLRYTLKDHSDAVYGVAFQPGGKWLATASADRAVKIWDAAQGKLLHTFSECTDWVYGVTWLGDDLLAGAGVDKSVRLWKFTSQGGRLVDSQFAHEGPVVKLFEQGHKLFSLGEDRSVKRWDWKDQKLVEEKVYPRFAETALALACRPGSSHPQNEGLGVFKPGPPQFAVGRLDGVLQLVDVVSGNVVAQPLPQKPKPPQPPPASGPKEAANPFPQVKELEPNNSPGGGQVIRLPASIAGAVNQAGDVDYFRFEAKKGQEIGVQLVTKAIGSKLDGYLELADARGLVLAQGNEGYLGFTCPETGWYALGVRDREFRGGTEFTYRLHTGDLPVVTSVFPLGVARGTEALIRLEGVHLPQRTVKLKVPADAVPGMKLPLQLTTPRGAPLGLGAVVVGEFPEVPSPGLLPVPGTGNGRIGAAGATGMWRFEGKKGQRLILEVEARRLGSPLDSFIEILDAKGQPVPRATLRSLARTFSVFRDHDSVGGNIRIEAWGELAVNDFVLVGGELMKIKELPTHPDADCIFFSERGQRLGFLDTTPTHHAMGVSMYKVAVHPPGMTFSPNGFPVTTLYYKNDDGGPGYGRDSRLFFDPPADGEYQVRISDARGQGGKDFGYRLTVRPPQPNFNVTFNPTGPAVWKGGAVPVSVTAQRLDGFDGEIALRLENLPPGFSAPPARIGVGDSGAAFALSADAAASSGKQPLKLIAEAVVDGKKIAKEVMGGPATLKTSGEIGITTAERTVVLPPGGETRLTVTIERRNGFTGRIPIEVRGLPHGVRVLNLGLNGILITERETVRTIVLYAEPWVQARTQPFVVLAKQEGKGTEFAAPSVTLKIDGALGVSTSR